MPLEPRLRLSRAYREVARDKSKFKDETKEFISSKLNAANWMIQAIEQRRQTMLKVMSFIVDRQRGFLEKGVQHMKPLTLREVAEHIEMHESTVSRVTNQKYVQTPRGVFSLKYFFSSGLSTTSGVDISARGVRAKIRALVNDEESDAVLAVWYRGQHCGQRLVEGSVGLLGDRVAVERDFVAFEFPSIDWGDLGWTGGSGLESSGHGPFQSVVSLRGGDRRCVQVVTTSLPMARPASMSP